MLCSLRLGVRSHCKRRESGVWLYSKIFTETYFYGLWSKFSSSESLYSFYYYTLQHISNDSTFCCSNMTKQQATSFRQAKSSQPESKCHIFDYCNYGYFIIITSHSLEAEVDVKYSQWQMNVLSASFNPIRVSRGARGSSTESMASNAFRLLWCDNLCAMVRNSDKNQKITMQIK